ncbi:MAG: hypothetical protein ABI628_04605 [Chloroflexota bacterium]
MTASISPIQPPPTSDVGSSSACQVSPMTTGDADGPDDGTGGGLTDATGGDVVIGSLV